MPQEVTGNSVNDQLGKSFVTMTANMERLSASENLIVQGILMDMEQDIAQKLQDNPDMTSWRKARYNALLSQVREQIKTTYKGIEEQHKDFLGKTGEAAARATETIFKGVGVPIQSLVLTPEQWKQLASRSMIEGAPLASWWGKQSQNLQDAFLQQMRIGYASGESIDQLVQRVRGKATGKRKSYIVNGKKKVFVEYKGGIMDVPKHHARTLVRTSIQQIAADAKMEAFKANSDIIKGVMWLATLDNRTTLVCASRSGKQWTLEGEPVGHRLSSLGFPPVHPNCRSTLVPITKSFEELGATPGITAEYLDKIGPGTRASMNGQVPAALTFDSWFRTLPEADQKAFLGPKKWEIWKKAGLNFQDMVDQRGNPLTLEQLAHAYGFKIKESIETGIPNVPKEMVAAIAVEQQAQAIASKRLQEQAEAEAKKAQESLDAIASSQDALTQQVYAQYKDELKGLSPQEALAYMQDKIAQAGEEALKAALEIAKGIAGNHALEGSILKIGNKTFDLLKPEDVAAFKKYKSLHLSSYKKAIIAGKKPGPVDTEIYNGLSEMEKTAFDVKLAQALDKKKTLPPTDNATPAPDTLQFSQMERIGPQRGSNEGGTYRDLKSGIEYYIKFPASEDIARNELLAAKLYRAAGVDVPELTLIRDGNRIGIASRMQAGLRTADPRDLGKAIGTGNAFGVDAWLANWDVTGASYDNLLLTEAGTAFRVDVGGALRYRAQGGLKGNAFGRKVTELESLRDASINKQAAKVFGRLTQADLEAGVRKVLEIPDDKIRDIVLEYGPRNGEEAAQLADLLILRKRYLAEKFPHLAAPKAAAPVSKADGLVSDALVDMVRKGRGNGYAIPADKEDIEDQSILTWFEKDEEGNDYTGLRFKMRPEIVEQVKRLMRRKKTGELKFSNIQCQFYKANIKNGYITRTKEPLVGQDMRSGRFGRVREAVASDGSRVRVWLNQDRAIDNQIEIVAKGADKESIARALNIIQNDLGISVEVPAAQDSEYAYLRMIARATGQWDTLQTLDGMKGAPLSERVAYAKKSISKSLGVDDVTKLQGYNPAGVHEAFDTGFRHFEMPQIPDDTAWEEFRAKYRLHHRITKNDYVTAVDRILNSGGKLVPTSDRLRFGIPWGGLSPEKDMKTGGGDFAFTRIKLADKQHGRSAYSQPGFVWKPEIIRRLDSISYNDDCFGRTTGDFVQNASLTSIADKINGAISYTNETNFKNGLSILDKLESFVVTTEQDAQELLMVLEKHGWGTKWADGRDTKEVIYIIEKQSFMSGGK